MRANNTSTRKACPDWLRWSQSLHRQANALFMQAVICTNCESMSAEFPSWQLLLTATELMGHEPKAPAVSRAKKQTHRPKVYPFIQATEDGFVCQICKSAVENGFMKLFPGSGAWVTKPMQNVNSKKWSQRCLKHVRSRTHKLALRSYPALRQLIDNVSSSQREDDEQSQSMDIAAIDYLELSAYLGVDARYPSRGSTRTTDDASGAAQASVFHGTNCDRYPFVERTEDGYWCRVCKSAYENGLIALNRNNGAWITQPISRANARKLGDKCAKHARSSIHNTAVNACFPSTP